VEDKGKGKANVIEVEDDDWGDDELLFDFESNLCCVPRQLF
jgi:hypothetical protein